MLILKSNQLTKIYMYSSIYFVHTSIPKNFMNFYYDPNTRIVGFSNLYENNYKNLYINQFSYTPRCVVKIFLSLILDFQSTYLENILHPS